MGFPLFAKDSLVASSYLPTPMPAPPPSPVASLPSSNGSMGIGHVLPPSYLRCSHSVSYPCLLNRNTYAPSASSTSPIPRSTSFPSRIHLPLPPPYPQKLHPSLLLPSPSPPPPALVLFTSSPPPSPLPLSSRPLSPSLDTLKIIKVDPSSTQATCLPLPTASIPPPPALSSSSSSSSSSSKPSSFDLHFSIHSPPFLPSSACSSTTTSTATTTTTTIPPPPPPTTTTPISSSSSSFTYPSRNAPYQSHKSTQTPFLGSLPSPELIPSWIPTSLEYGLNRELWITYKDISPSDTQMIHRQRLVDKLQKWVNKEWPHFHISVLPFG
ncbi:hypothetical protein HMI54_010320 [Coelomomyces lativittatus]|nr:hypothetical protein HMI54_010320 [Coelomomyces lativittatus]